MAPGHSPVCRATMTWPRPARRRAWCWRVASVITSTTSRSLYLLGLVAHNQGNLDQARPSVRRSIRACPRRVAILTMRRCFSTVLEIWPLRKIIHSQLRSTTRMPSPSGVSDATSGESTSPCSISAMWRCRSGELARAGEFFGEGLVISAEVGDQARIADYLDAVGRLAADAGQPAVSGAIAQRSNYALQEGCHRAVPGHRGAHRAAR